MSKLTTNRYGKHKVRVLKVNRDEEHHEVCELEADVMLSGDLEASYHSEDNSSIVPTDTVKNTVHVLAHDHLKTSRGAFATVLGEHFLGKYGHLSEVEVELRERRWKRMSLDDGLHPHSFVAEGNGCFYTKGCFSRGKNPEISSGMRDHLIMNTTESGFIGYNQCDFTTLPPTTDRILATRLSAEWSLQDVALPDIETERKVLDATYAVFANNYSPSVQRTLLEIGEAVLEAAAEVKDILLRMPNVHYLGLDLNALGRLDQQSVFLPTDEPHGQIEALVSR
ncbi:MAG: factor-independent urate hydroxylase [Verrucomicrobiota bacterium]